MDKSKIGRSNNDVKDSSVEVLWQKKLEAQKQKLADAENITQALISSIGEGIIVVNEYGDITDVNDVALKLLDYKKQDLEGEWLPRILPLLDKKGRILSADERPILQALLTGQPQSGTGAYLKKDGTTIPVYTTASPYEIKDKPRGAIIVFRDISREANIERAKDEFISITSHQLRTPLTAIRLFIDLLQDPMVGSLSDVQRDYIDKIQLSVDRLLQLVGDFLNIAKLELGELEVSNQLVDLNKLIESQIDEVRPSHDSSNLKIDFAPSKMSKVHTDEQLLSEALHNLLTNAVRYTSSQDGRIIVKLNRDGRKVTITVADNGIGIPSSAQPQIFERLFRASNAIDTQPEGTGLGLYLARKIALALGGDISFKSQKNKGTTFYFSLLDSM